MGPIAKLQLSRQSPSDPIQIYLFHVSIIAQNGDKCVNLGVIPPLTSRDFCAILGYISPMRREVTMAIADIMKDCQGELSNKQFSKRLGISYSMLTKIYLGVRSPGIKVIERLAQEYPEKKDAVWAVFLSENGDKGHRLETERTIEIA